MFITAAMMTLTTLAATSGAPAADQSPPYTLSGVRQADAAAQAAVQAGEVRTPESPTPPASLRRPADSADGQELNLGGWVPPREVTLPGDDRVVTPSLAQSGPVWHRAFRAMTVPAEASSPFGLMPTRERAAAVASSVGVGLVIEGLIRLVDSMRTDYDERKLAALRRQIDEEAASARNGAGRGAGSNLRVQNPASTAVPPSCSICCSIHPRRSST